MTAVRFIDSNRQAFYFIAPSETVPDRHYDIFIDRKSGIVKCDCKDAQCRRKNAHLVDLLSDAPPESCKHVRALLAAYRGLLDA